MAEAGQLKYQMFGFPLSAVDPFVDDEMIFLRIHLWCGCISIVVLSHTYLNTRLFINVAKT